MRLLAILAVILISLSCAGQEISRFSALLRKGNIEDLTRHVDSLMRTNAIYLAMWNSGREILPGYEERSTDISPVKPGNTGKHQNFNIELLSRNGRIFYYRFTEMVLKEKAYKNDSQRWNYVVIDSFCDASAYSAFETAFFNAYGVKLDKADLFVSNIVYGELCGLDANAPGYRRRLNALVEKRDAKTIHSWLRSPNTEKQLYGLQGVYALEQFGLEIPAQDAQIIKLIRQKKGSVYTCAGCFYSYDSIHKVIDEIDNQRGKYQIRK